MTVVNRWSPGCLKDVVSKLTSPHTKIRDPVEAEQHTSLTCDDLRSGLSLAVPLRQFDHANHSTYLLCPC